MVDNQVKYACNISILPIFVVLIGVTKLYIRINGATEIGQATGMFDDQRNATDGGPCTINLALIIEHVRQLRRCCEHHSQHLNTALIINIRQLSYASARN